MLLEAYAGTHLRPFNMLTPFSALTGTPQGIKWNLTSQFPFLSEGPHGATDLRGRQWWQMNTTEWMEPGALNTFPGLTSPTLPQANASPFLCQWLVKSTLVVEKVEVVSVSESLREVFLSHPNFIPDMGSLHRISNNQLLIVLIWYRRCEPIVTSLLPENQIEL